MCKRIFNEQTSPDGEIPFYKIGSFGRTADAFITRELYLDFKKRFSFPKKGEILISAAGTIGRTVIYDGEDAYYQDSNIVWIDNDESIVTNSFLYYILQIVKFNTEGGTIQRLYNNILRSTKFQCPEISEQKKISEFLKKIDARIQTQNKIIEEIKLLKSTLCEMLYSSFEQNYENEYCVRDLLDYFQPNKYIVSNTEYSLDRSLVPVLTANKSFILGYSDDTEGICNIGECIIFDDFTMDMKFVDFPFKVKSSAIKILKPKPSSNIRFLYYYLKYLNLESSEHKRHYISELEPLKLKLPSITEQLKVSKIMKVVDEKIIVETNILFNYSKQKDYLLRKLF